MARDVGESTTEEIVDEHVLDLSVYEAGNVFWKASTLLDRINDGERDRLVALLADLEEQVELTPVHDLNLDRTMAIAADAELTFYDTARAARAENDDLTLVIEDGTLRERANEFVASVSLDAL